MNDKEAAGPTSPAFLFLESGWGAGVQVCKECDVTSTAKAIVQLRP